MDLSINISYFKELDEYIDGLTDNDIVGLKSSIKKGDEEMEIKIENETKPYNKLIPIIKFYNTMSLSEGGYYVPRNYLYKIRDFELNKETKYGKEMIGDKNIDFVKKRGLFLKRIYDNDYSNIKFRIIVGEITEYITNNYNDFKNIILCKRNLISYGTNCMKIFKSFNNDQVSKYVAYKIEVNINKDTITIISYNKNNNKTKRFNNFPPFEELMFF